MSKRQPGLDLLRCLAALLVVTAHSFLSNGYTLTPQTGVVMWLCGSVRQLGRCSVGIYLMLSGYLQSNKTDWKACYRSLPTVLLSYFLVAAISIPIRHFVFGDVQSLTTWVQRLFGYSGAYYGWYVEIYVGLTLLTPFLNLAIKNATDKQLLGFSAVLLFLSALPGLTPWVVVSDYWKFLYPISYYLLGAIFRRVQPKIKPIYGLLVAVAVTLMMGAGIVLSTDGTFNDAYAWEFGDLCMVIVTLGLFVSMYRLNIPKILSKILAFAATGCFGSYLLSHLLDAVCYNWVMPWRKEGRFLLIFLCITLPIYLVSILMGIGLDRICKPILLLGGKAVEGLKKVFGKKLPQI